MEENNHINTDHRFRKTRRDYWKIATVILAVLLIVSVYRSGWLTGASVLSSDEAGQKALTYINDNLMPATTKAELKSVTEENGLYKLIVTIEAQEVPLFATKDGNLIFVQYFDTTKELPALDTQNNQAQAQEIVKSDKPVVEVFVMSHCPYGTQIEKGILPVAKALGNKIDFQIKFVNYAMHGETEVKEELNQYCINKEQADKYTAYLECFLKEGKGDACLVEAKIDNTKLTSCLNAAEKEFKTLALFADKTTWSGGQFPQFPIYDALNKKYGVQGSPTLVINGAQVQSARDSASLLKTICSAFNEAPDACSKQLSSAAPSPGFGTGTTTGSTTAGCATS